VELLKRVLILQAAVWATCGLAIALAPRFVLVTLFDLPEPPDLGYVRVAGVCSLSLAMLMVLLSRRLAELWWWSWAFVVAAAGTALIAFLNALFGLPDGASPLLWWLFAAAGSAFTAGLLAGLARAGTERPPL
jgi:hypothetical protein